MPEACLSTWIFGDYIYCHLSGDFLWTVKKRLKKHLSYDNARQVCTYCSEENVITQVVCPQGLSLPISFEIHFWRRRKTFCMDSWEEKDKKLHFSLWSSKILEPLWNDSDFSVKRAQRPNGEILIMVHSYWKTCLVVSPQAGYVLTSWFSNPSSTLYSNSYQFICWP